MHISDKLDSCSSPIVDLKYDFKRLIALKHLWLVEDVTGIVSKILMMLYIAGYKSRFVACRVSSSFSVLSSTRAHIISKAQPHPENLLSCVNLSNRHWTICQLFQVLGLEDLQGLDKMPQKTLLIAYYSL